MINKILHTKWGKAKNYKGYWRINSKKEGNQGKYLHRLIWEDFYNTEVPKGYVIHHRDHNPLNNCILNLQLMRQDEHVSLHNIGEKHPMYGKCHSEEAKMKMSTSRKGKTFSEEHKQNLSKSLSGENNPMYGKYHSEESKLKISGALNNSGYYCVCKHKDKKCKQGFIWRYQYYEDGKRKSIDSVDIGKLEQKVKAKGLKWKKIKGG